MILLCATGPGRRSVRSSKVTQQSTNAVIWRGRGHSDEGRGHSDEGRYLGTIVMLGVW